MKKKLLSRAAIAALLSLPFTTAQVQAAGRDLDGDGIPNIVDPDIDNDGIPNALDRNVDGGVAKAGPFAGQYLGDNLDNDNPAERDIDDDGQPDDSLGESDIDGDGKRDDSSLETDTDGDKRADDHPSESDLDGDGRRNDDDRDFDIDGDGLDDDDNSEMDIDGDDRDDDSDSDIDGDNRGNGDASEDDTDGDGRKDDSASESNDDGDRLDDRMDSDDDNDGSDDNEDSDHHQEDDEQEVQISLTKQAAAPSGSRVRVKIQQMASGKTELELDGRDLPAGSYDVNVDGILIGQLVFEGNKETEAEQEWETNANDQDEINLTIPVIGKPISVSLGGVVYYSGTVPTPPPPSGGGGTPPTPAAGDLIASAAAPAGANGKVEVEFSTAGMHSLEIEFEDVAAGTYTLTIGDTARGTSMVAAGGQGRFKFETSPEASEGELPLDFPAAGLPVTISLDGTVIFTGTVPAAPPGVGDGGDDDGNDDNGGGTPIVAQLTRGAAAPAGSKAEIQVQFGAAGAVGVEVEAEDLPAGDYTFTVDGTARGTLTVSAGEGKLRYEVVPNDPGEQQLDFAISGLPVTLSQGETVFFSGTAPVAPGA